MQLQYVLNFRPVKIGIHGKAAEFAPVCMTVAAGSSRSGEMLRIAAADDKVSTTAAR